MKTKNPHNLGYEDSYVPFFWVVTIQKQLLLYQHNLTFPK